MPPDVIAPREAVRHKSHIPKVLVFIPPIFGKALKSNSSIALFVLQVMFLTAIGKPCPAAGFDGKIGAWPFTELVPAQRSSKNRPKGAMVLRDVSCDGPAWVDMMANKVFR